MSIFSRSTKNPRVEAETIQSCQHRDLAPRWGSASDMGKAELITSFECAGCRQSFTPAQVVALRLAESKPL